MQKLMTTTLFLALALTFACKSNRAARTDDAASPAGKGNSAQATLGGKAVADSLFLSVERTPCFGMCKAYRLNVYRSGYATFEGRVHVEKEGMHQGRVGQDTLQAILREAERIGFFGLNDVYDSQVTDLPSTIIRITADGKDKTVLGRVGVPEKFRNFTEFVEERLLPMPWKPVVPQP